MPQTGFTGRPMFVKRLDAFTAIWNLAYESQLKM